jgi:acylphosphatase
MPELHLKIIGQVQGVGFRYSCKQKADELKLTGWVKNLPDGSVETIACGEEKQLTKYEQWIKVRTGIQHVQSLPFTDGEVFTGFSVRF